MNHAVIVDVVRTASGKGKPGGALSETHPTDLLAGVLRALLERNGLDSMQIDDVLVGCVSQIGEQSGNVARNSLLAAGFDDRVPGVSIDRQCGSSQQAAHFGAQGVIAGRIRHRHRGRRRVDEPGAARLIGERRVAVRRGHPRTVPEGLGQPGRLCRTDRREVGSQPRPTRRSSRQSRIGVPRRRRPQEPLPGSCCRSPSPTGRYSRPTRPSAPRRQSTLWRNSSLPSTAKRWRCATRRSTGRSRRATRHR